MKCEKTFKNNITSCIGIMILDTIQSKVFNRNPLFKINENYNGGNLYQKKKGILVDTYVCIEQSKKTVFKWEKYNCTSNIIDKDKYSRISEHSFYGKIIESYSNYIIVTPNKIEMEYQSSDKFHINLDNNNDLLYKVGDDVKITYLGDIHESYPAQIQTTKIELKSPEKFELDFSRKNNQPKKKEIIISKNEIKDVDYNIYAYEGNVKIKLYDKKEFSSLRDALLEKKITIEEILKKASQNIIHPRIANDGGSIEYHYPNYTIIKCHTVDGNKDIYFGDETLTLDDIKK